MGKWEQTVLTGNNWTSGASGASRSSGSTPNTPLNSEPNFEPTADHPSRRSPFAQAPIPPLQGSSAPASPHNFPRTPNPRQPNPHRRSLPVKRKYTLLQRLVLGLEAFVMAIAGKLPDSSDRQWPQQRSQQRSQQPRRGGPPDPRDQPFGRFPLPPQDSYPPNRSPRYSPQQDPFAPPHPVPPGDRRRARKQSQTTPLWLQTVRTGIVGIGLGAIVGTVMLAIDPASRQTALSNSPQLPLNSGQLKANDLPQDTAPFSGPPTVAQSNPPLPAANPFTKRSDALQKKVKGVVSKYKGLSARVAVVDLDTGDYAVWNDRVSSRAASTIKAPVLVAFFQDVDAGKTTLDQPITLEKRLLTGEAGVLQYQKPGTKVTALDVLNKMIVISDNAATNLAINHLGGAAAVNQRFRQWGLEETTIRTWLPDIGGTNTITARDMAVLFFRLHRGELVSLRSRDRLLAILRNTRNRSLLNQGIGKGGTIAHKTGTLNSTLADVGLVDAPNGRRYAIAAIVHRPSRDARAGQLIRELSKVTYQHFSNLKPLAR